MEECNVLIRHQKIFHCWDQWPCNFQPNGSWQKRLSRTIPTLYHHHQQYYFPFETISSMLDSMQYIKHKMLFVSQTSPWLFDWNVFLIKVWALPQTWDMQTMSVNPLYDLQFSLSTPEGVFSGSGMTMIQFSDSSLWLTTSRLLFTNANDFTRIASYSMNGVSLLKGTS